MSKVNLLGTDVWAMTMQDVVLECEKQIENKTSLLIGVVNVAKLVNSRKDIELKKSLEEANFIVADGLPVVWLSQLCGKPLPERVAGIDIMINLLELADKKKYRVFFLGAKPEVVKKVVQWTKNNYHGVRVAGFRDGYFSAGQEGEIAGLIRDSGADILFVAISPPKKEIFLRKYSAFMNIPVCHGVGGSFDVVAGKTKRAPKWMQECALEWLYRVIQEPGRMWKRYFFTNIQFIGLSFFEVCKHRLGVK